MKFESIEVMIIILISVILTATAFGGFIAFGHRADVDGCSKRGGITVPGYSGYLCLKREVVLP